MDDRCGVISFRWHGSDLLLLPFYPFRSGPGIPGRVSLPEIDIDGLARIHPPKNGQINLDSVYQLIAGWKALGIPIEWVSFDGFQSADLIQRIGRLGIRTGRLSVDMTSPRDPMQAYETLRNAVSEGRFRFPDDRDTVRDMLALQADYKKQRVDHIPNQKKTRRIIWLRFAFT